MATKAIIAWSTFETACNAKELCPGPSQLACNMSGKQTNVRNCKLPWQLTGLQVSLLKSFSNLHIVVKESKFTRGGVQRHLSWLCSRSSTHEILARVSAWLQLLKTLAHPQNHWVDWVLERTNISMRSGFKSSYETCRAPGAES